MHAEIAAFLCCYDDLIWISRICNLVECSKSPSDYPISGKHEHFQAWLCDLVVFERLKWVGGIGCMSIMFCTHLDCSSFSKTTWSNARWTNHACKESCQFQKNGSIYCRWTQIYVFSLLLYLTLSVAAWVTILPNDGCRLPKRNWLISQRVYTSKVGMAAVDPATKDHYDNYLLVLWESHGISASFVMELSGPFYFAIQNFRQPQRFRAQPPAGCSCRSTVTAAFSLTSLLPYPGPFPRTPLRSATRPSGHLMTCSDYNPEV